MTKRKISILFHTFTNKAVHEIQVLIRKRHAPSMEAGSQYVVYSSTACGSAVCRDNASSRAQVDWKPSHPPRRRRESIWISAWTTRAIIWLRALSNPFERRSSNHRPRSLRRVDTVEMRPILRSA